MLNANTGTCSAESHVPRVYLQIHHKRRRDGFVEGAPSSQYVRVQWDTAEMGAPPAPLQRALATRTKFLFRRLPNPSKNAVTVPPTPSAQLGLGVAPVDKSEEGSVGGCAHSTQPSRTHVERVTQTGGCVLIQCGELSLPDTSADAAVEADTTTVLYVLDPRASEAEALEDAFGEFAITDDDTGVFADGGSIKRQRDTHGDIADVFLAPVRRLEAEQDHAAAPWVTSGADAADAASRWGPVEEDATGTMWAMLRAYDVLLCVESAGEATADLYCYPDHRKDDEYDSNAEDFSGNDYPDDADNGDGDRDEVSSHSSNNSSCGEYKDVSSSSTGRHGRRGRGYEAYGMFCEEGYSERSLSSGWGSDDN